MVAMNTITSIKATDLQRLGVSKPYSHQLLAGGRMPSLELAVLLETKLGIPVRAWPLPVKKAANDASPSREAA